MAKNSITDYSKTASLNTDIQSVDIDEGCLPSGINNAIRELMADLAAVNDGTVALTSPAFTSVDINSGTIDGVIIGGASAAAGTFTTGQFNTSLNVDGTVTADGLTIDNVFSFDNSGFNGEIKTYGSGTGIIYDALNGYHTFRENGTARMQIRAGGDIYLGYEDTGTTPKLFWDASAESLGLGTTSPEGTLHVESITNNSIIMDSPANRYNSIGFQTAGAGKWWLGRADSDIISGDAFFIGNDNGNLTDAGGFSSKLVVTQAGSVGIGTSSPASLVTGGSSPVLTIGGTDSGLVTGEKSGAISFITNDGSYTGTYSDGITGEIASVSESAVGGAYGLAFYTGTTTSSNRDERVRIDALGRVGLGTDLPQTLLDISDTRSGTRPTLSAGTFLIVESTANPAAFVGAAILGGASGASILNLGDANDEDVGQVSYHHSDNSMRFKANANERARLDASGNWMVGMTTASSSNDGFAAYSSGYVSITDSGFQPLILNRKSNDGTIVDFRKDGTTVGAIGVNASTLFQVSSSSTGGLFLADNATNVAGFVNGENAFRPASDNFISLGKTDRRFKDLYLGGGVYVGGTGDANKLDDYEEGTWTPVLSDGTNNATSSVAEGQYTKVGRQVTLSGRFTLSSLGSVSGSTRITGLPFAVSSGNAGRGSLNVSYAAAFNLSSGYTIIGSPAPGASSIYLGVWDIASGTTDLQASEMSATSTLYFSATYFV